MNAIPGADSLAAEVAAMVDTAAGGPVMVLGSLPPAGRDLDVLAREPERGRIAAALSAEGLVRKRSQFALFRSCSAYGVELLAAEQFLPEHALSDLYAQALALDGFTSLHRPAPVHALLILARLVLEEGALAPKRRARLERILAEDPNAWQLARPLAGEWRAGAALTLLERLALDDKGIPHAKRLQALSLHALPRPRPGVLVALSGIDGAGKSSQARWLSDSMRALGVETDVVWNNLLGHRALNLLAAAPKALLRAVGRQKPKMASFDERASAQTSGSATVTQRAWSTIVTLANALEQRLAVMRSMGRGRVTVFDRSPLDLAVRMEVLYRTNVRLQRALVRRTAPRPKLAFLLDIPAEVSLARKNDVWSPSQLHEQVALYRTLAPSFGVRILDGERPAEELAAEIARETWLALG